MKKIPKVTRSTHAFERIVKGFANHRRIAILYLLERTPELSLEDIAEKLKINYKTASDHVRRLAIAGLLLKRHDFHVVRHKLTARAVLVLKFLRTLE